GLTAADFVRVISVQRLTPNGLRGLAPTITTLARAEGLEGHAASIDVRTAPGRLPRAQRRGHRP
ncbi:MAG: histidinol dehydrogenase, partial [Vicinamibacterales bacterium]